MFLVFSCPLTLTAQESGTDPVLIRDVPAWLPADFSGIVQDYFIDVRVEVLPDSTVGRIIFPEPAGELEETVRESVSQWRFKPATRDGVTVTAYTEVTVLVSPVIGEAPLQDSLRFTRMEMEQIISDTLISGRQKRSEKDLMPGPGIFREAYHFYGSPIVSPAFTLNGFILDEGLVTGWHRLQVMSPFFETRKAPGGYDLQTSFWEIEPVYVSTDYGTGDFLMQHIKLSLQAYAPLQIPDLATRFDYLGYDGSWFPVRELSGDYHAAARYDFGGNRITAGYLRMSRDIMGAKTWYGATNPNLSDVFIEENSSLGFIVWQCPWFEIAALQISEKLQPLGSDNLEKVRSYVRLGTNWNGWLGTLDLGAQTDSEGRVIGQIGFSTQSSLIDLRPRLRYGQDYREGQVSASMTVPGTSGALRLEHTALILDRKTKDQDDGLYRLQESRWQVGIRWRDTLVLSEEDSLQFDLFPAIGSSGMKQYYTGNPSVRFAEQPEISAEIQFDILVHPFRFSTGGTALYRQISDDDQYSRPENEMIFQGELSWLLPHQNALIAGILYHEYGSFSHPLTGEIESTTRVDALFGIQISQYFRINGVVRNLTNELFLLDQISHETHYGLTVHWDFFN